MDARNREFVRSKIVKSCGRIVLVDSDSTPLTAWLTVRRTSAEDVQQRELYASLDGKRIAIILYGDVATVTIPPGHHELRVHNTLSRKRAEFDAAPGQHVRFAAANVPGKAFAYWAFFVGAALMWTTLERESDGERPAGAVRETFRV
jgi:hypothetical protein